MKRALLAVGLLAAPLFHSCTTYSVQQFVGSDDYELARTESPDGVLQVYRLQNGDALSVTTEYERERPFLGLGVRELDKERAKRRGVDAYAGLLVVETIADSSARAAGVRPDDILLSIDGNETSYVEHLDTAEASFGDRQEVVARLLRGDQELELTLRTELVRETVTERQNIRLQSAPPNQRAYAGVTLKGIPPDWCERIFGEPREAVVVATVELGSPAWIAGIRSGDVIDTVDGTPVPAVSELSRIIAAKGQAGEIMTWGVRREQGRSYEASIELEDYQNSSGFGIPLLFNYSNTTARDRWRIGLGLIMGNRNEYVADATTRRLQTRNVFSALLGLFKVDSSPDETRVRLLWLIHFDT